MKISPVHHAFPQLNVADMIREELPFANEIYNHKGDLHKDMQDVFAFYLTNAGNLPMYALERGAADGLLRDLTRYADMLMAALERLFLLPDEEIRQWYACSYTEHPGFAHFLRYAREVFANRMVYFGSDTVYGRVDGMVDPVTGKLMGVYEFNGDTPVMLFESVNLQNLLSTMLGDPSAQANDWWEQSIQGLSRFRGKDVAIVCDVNWIEDTLTSETIAQVFHAVGARSYLTTLQSLNHDVLSMEKPFFVDGVSKPMDAVFMLLPWEEMWSTGTDILSHWQHWYNRVTFFEPAWRWFLANKAILAWVTHLMETDESFRAKWSDVAHLRTYMTPDRFIAEGRDYVSKPVIGRLSQNISVVRQGQTSAPTEGMYGGEPMVYQEFLAPGKVEGRNNFIIGGWMAGGEVASLCFREFDGAVLDLMNERFIAHQLVD